MIYEQPNIRAEVIKETLSYETGKESLITVKLTYPSIIHNQLMSHRALNKNSASNRAVPSKHFINVLNENCFIPVFRKAQKGMVSGEILEDEIQEKAKIIWKNQAESSAKAIQELLDLGVSKETTNRLSFPFSWIETLVTGNKHGAGWKNFFSLRTSKDAQPEIRELAFKILDSFECSIPEENEIHCPFLLKEEIDYIKDRFETPQDLIEELGNFTYLNTLKKLNSTNDKNLPIFKLCCLLVSANRCKRVSYFNLDKKLTITEEIKQCLESLKSGHFSIAEHSAIKEVTSYKIFNTSNSLTYPFIPLRALLKKKDFSDFNYETKNL